MKNKTNTELVALLTDPKQKEAAGLQLLQQSPSQNDLCELIHKKVQQKAPWQQLKQIASKKALLSLLPWFDQKDELEEALLKFDHKLSDLRWMLTCGTGKEATWERLLQQSPDKDTFFTLLNCDISMRDVIAEYLLTQPDDNDLLKMIIMNTGHARMAWERLKKREITSHDLRGLLRSEVKQDVWELFLALSPSKFDLHLVMAYDQEFRETAIAELWKRQPTKEDLISIVECSNKWETAWAELLKQGLENIDLCHLIYNIGFRPAWELLKQRSPKPWEIQHAIQYEFEKHEALWAEMGAYLLTLSPSKDDLKFLIDYVPEVKDAAIELLSQQNPDDNDMEIIMEYRVQQKSTGIDLEQPLTKSELVDLIAYSWDHREKAWELYLKQSPTKEELMNIVYKAAWVFSDAAWEELKKHPLTKEELLACISRTSQMEEAFALWLQYKPTNEELLFMMENHISDPSAEQLLRQSPSGDELLAIMRGSHRHHEAAWKMWLGQSPSTEEVSEVLDFPYMNEIVATELLKRKDVSAYDLFKIIRDTKQKEAAWQQLKALSGATDEWKYVMLNTSYREQVWTHWKKENMEVALLVELIEHKYFDYKNEAAEELRRRFLVEAEDEELLKRRIAVQILDEGGGLRKGEPHHDTNAHTLAGWVTTLSEQGRKLEIAYGTITAACAMTPTLACFFSESLEIVKEELLRIKLVKG